MSKPLSVPANNILAFCRNRSFKKGHVLSLSGAFLHSFYQQLNPREQHEIENTLEELVDAGAFRRDGEQFILTEVGFDLLYPPG